MKPTWNPTGMTAAVEPVSPAKAASYLAMSAGNRHTRRHRLEAYCRDRQADRWVLNGQGLIFGTDGRLYDGHHRCEMVVRTGLATPMLVVREMDPKAAQYIDSGLPRGSRDALRMAGMGDYSDALISTARVLKLVPATCSTGGASSLTNEELRQIIDDHAEPLTFACESMAGVNGVSRGSRALIARAYWNVDRNRLAEFCQVMQSGLPISKQVSADQGAIAYSRLLTNSMRTQGHVIEKERYCKGQTCLRAFLKNEPISKVYGTDEDLYPLPE